MSPKGRGSLWVAVQSLLFAAYALAPTLRDWKLHVRPAWIPAWIGWPLIAYGAGMALPSALKLGRDLTPFPEPRRDAGLITTGPFRLVRNPLYSALSALFIGFALVTGSAGRLVLGFAILFFLDRKSTAEEERLAARFPEYPGYRNRVKKLIPFLY
jgi:protein-S-isoprenylcysteine O-methyltransferase Ste14